MIVTLEATLCLIGRIYERIPFSSKIYATEPGCGGRCSGDARRVAPASERVTPAAQRGVEPYITRDERSPTQTLLGVFDYCAFGKMHPLVQGRS